jgi:hypothetical protein
MNYHRQHWKKWAKLVGDFVPAVDAALGVHDVVDHLARPDMPYVRRGHPMITNVPYQFPGPPPNQWRLTDVLNRVGGLLAAPPDAPDGQQRMDAIDGLLHTVPPVELDIIVVRLGPAGLEALNKLLWAVEEADNTWNFCRVQAFLNFLLEHVSPYAVGLIGIHVRRSQPVISDYWEDGHDDGWLLPAGPFVVFDDKAYRADDGYRVEASVAPVAWQDMRQGSIGDCWFLTSVQAVVKANPGFLPHHMRQNPNGTVTVIFFHSDDRRPCPITVPPDLPVRNGKLFGASGHTNDPAYAELWPAYYEKAFAHWKGGYESIDGGLGDRALRAITGRPVEELDPESPHLIFEIHDRIQRGYAMVVGTVGESDRHKILDGRLVGRHEYFIKEVNPGAGQIALGNPWGDRSSRTEWECWLTQAEAAAHLHLIATVWPW